ncbi:hypothetical protein LEM8419_01503 [Neolewinella maritima]|uniref:S41 family peptidase n=1 Tax=Neolewinella maritima TaxID=1383882 RepID=A0ABM9AZY9_9BACT|nr:S41 family peptidase [Neolewinella maritima]CAH1000350.1 hypothetical protein LEM8419_01503 [Neolewinella maritima]
MNERTASIWTPLVYSLLLASGLLIGYLLQSDGPLLSVSGSGTGPGGKGGRVEQVLGYVDARYVDEPDQEQLTRTAIEAVLADLDPHSSYIAPDELQALNDNMEGNFKGIGIEYLVIDDTITVVSALSGGPSDAAGVRSGDQVIYVGDSLVTGVLAKDIDPASLMQGPEGTEVTIRVRRDQSSDLLPFVIGRASIPLTSVDAAYTIDPDIAYVRINRFSKTTYSEFMAALEEHLEEAQAKHLILDLRGNPGGYLQEATKLLSELFVERGVLLVYTEGRSSSRQPYKSSGRARYNIQNVAILVDGGSASASEIVAGAVQDHDRGIVVGRRTFGKGLVQEQYPLGDGGALRLTVARYYTPSDRSIQRSYNGEEDYRGDLGRRYASGELTGRTAAAVDSSLTYYTDNGHPVFGGGGITPDYFVALDSSLSAEPFLKLRQQVPAYVFTYVREHADLGAYASLEDFTRQFRPDMTAVIADLQALADDDYPDRANTLSPTLRKELGLFFRARLARQLFDSSAYFVVYNQEDDVVQEALRLLRDSDPLAAARSTGL